MRVATCLVSLTGFSMLLPTGIAASAEKLEVGAAAPTFACRDDSGNVWKSEEHYGKKIVVVYFYPAALTGGCTKQACGYRDDLSRLADKGIEVVGVSGDEVAGLQLFRKAHDLNFTLLADSDGAVAKKFGVPLRDGGEITRELDGQSFVLKRGVTAGRWTFVVDRDSKIAAAYQVANAGADSKTMLGLVEKLDK